jgi:hypothetical protein
MSEASLIEERAFLTGLSFAWLKPAKAYPAFFLVSKDK